MSVGLFPPRGRLAPSPTGRLHLGNAFAFLAAWLSARKQGGALVLRLEDIDPERSRASFADGIVEDLAWLGLTWDEGPDKGGPHAPYAQSARFERYAALLADFARRGLIYPCYCTRKELRTLASAPHVGDEGAPYPGTCRTLDGSALAAHAASGKKASLRLNADAAMRIPGTERAKRPAVGIEPLSFHDAVLGEQRRSLRDCGGDFALRRSDDVVAYQLAVAADDAAMGITEVVRGDDLLPSTPRQLLLFRLMGKNPPSYAHLPLLRDAQGQRLAKRHKALELASLRSAGIAPAAVTGFLAFLAGWLDKPEAAGPEELLPYFSWQRLQSRLPNLPEDPLAALGRI
jgi:glutamyl-tRNA synthetase